MTIPTLALARALRRTRPPVWPLRFVVSKLEPATRTTPGAYRAHAQSPSGTGIFVIDAVGAHVTLRFESSRGRGASTSEHASIDDAETAAMQAALRELGRYRPRLRWQRTKVKDFAVQAQVDLPIWGAGVLLLPGAGATAWQMAQWSGVDPWGQPFRSSMPTSREGMQRFVDDWLAMTTSGVRFYRAFPYLVGKDEAYPDGAARQLRTAEIVEAATKVPARRQSRTDRDLALVTLHIGPFFNWDMSSGGARWKPVPGKDHPSKRSAEHEGFFGIGQIVGAYEIVEYTTGPHAQVRSLGVWKPPTLEVWRTSGAVATKIEPRRASHHGSYGQLELLAEIAAIALEVAAG